MSSVAKLRDHISIFYGPPMTVLSDCLRGFLEASPGHDFIACDFSAIEARVIAWLAGQESVLEVFRTHGKIYEHEARGIFGLKSIDDVTEFQRLIGKVATLALGFQGGVGAFQSMAKVYFIKVPDSQAETIKNAWRNNNPKIVKYWQALEDAAFSATKNPGEKYQAGEVGRRVTFLRRGSFLFCQLPSGRALSYPYPQIDLVTTPWDAKKWAVTYKTEINKTWVRVPTYGGHLAENVTQATARDLLVEAMHRWEAHHYPIVLHIHDELVAEVKENFGSLDEAKKLMCELPAWAKDLPIAAGGWRDKRYQKGK